MAVCGAAPSAPPVRAPSKTGRLVFRVSYLVFSVWGWAFSFSIRLIYHQQNMRPYTNERIALAAFYQTQKTKHKTLIQFNELLTLNPQ